MKNSSLFYWDYIKSMKLGFHPFLFFMSSVTREKQHKKEYFYNHKGTRKKKAKKFFYRWENLNFFSSFQFFLTFFLFFFIEQKKKEKKTSIHYITYPYACGIHILSGMAIFRLVTEALASNKHCQCVTWTHERKKKI